MIRKIVQQQTNSLFQKSCYQTRKQRYYMGLSDDQIQNLKNLKEFELKRHIEIRIDRVAEISGIPKDKIEFYKKCDQLVRFQLPYETEDGTIKQVTAYRVQHKTHRLPSKGGLRINRYNTSEDLEAIALQNAIKSAIFDIPLGGAKGLIKVNPYTITEKQREILVKRYTIELAKKNLIGPSIDLIGPAIGSGPQEMDWIKDTYQNYFGQEDIHSIACVTGKSVSNFGIEGGKEGLGYGLAFCLKYLLENKEFCKKNKLDSGIKGKTFIVQGFGNSGYNISKFLVQEGAILVGVMEYDGQLFNQNGIDPEALRAHMDNNQNDIREFSAAQHSEGDSLMETECDIFIPSWTENVIHKENQSRLKCKMIAEGCNHPITTMAGELLRQRGVYVFPDLLVNAGGVITAYFEWIKNLSHAQHGLLTKRWEQKSKVLLLDTIQSITGLRTNVNTEQLDKLKGASEWDIVKSGLEEYLSTALDTCIKVSEEKQIPLRWAAYLIGLQKIHLHYESVGIPFTKGF